MDNHAKMSAMKSTLKSVVQEITASRQRTAEGDLERSDSDPLTPDVQEVPEPAVSDGEVQVEES